ncbi:protein chibby homolog 1 isoform X3 [Plutella xylostella]|uniref:protein chibby homolog 1 isoform X2 n=1 Tax=Plutella xylostella TaxID=51655 RepID=UPI0020326A41|nr:protein chibby homolog 1 isoform X2 [Plutella xylostella]XP_048482791.1 protein chibby homolog 1 isoform X3 [Plutella xylostella]
MPLFGSKFSGRGAPARRRAAGVVARELGAAAAAAALALDPPPLTLALGDATYSFQHGQWTPASGRAGAAAREAARLRAALAARDDEVNLLRLKVEILLDMLSDAGAQ